MASSVYCDDPYLSSLVIENLKDRAITIFEIYLKVGNHCYIQIEDLVRQKKSWAESGSGSLPSE
jgi:hypothetical protein